MTFQIYYTDSLPLDYKSEKKYGVGYIELPGGKESISSALDVFCKRDYISQWIEAVEAIEGGGGKSAFITSYADRGGEIVGMWWTIYHLDENVDRCMLCNQLLLKEYISKNFSLENFFGDICEYDEIGAEDESFDEWEVSFQELKDFKKQLLMM